MAKKYFWLKLKDDFFNQKEIKMLRRIAGGDTHTIIYLKMLLLSIKNDGKIYYDGITSSMVEEIALEIDEEVENVSITFNYLQSKGLIVFNSDDEIELSNIHSMIGSESASASRVRKHRASKALHCNNEVTDVKRLSNTEIEIDKEIEKDIDKEIQLQLQKEDGQMSDKNPPEIELDIEKDIEKEIQLQQEGGGGSGVIESFATFQQLYTFPNLVQQEDLKDLIDKYSDELVNASLKVAGTNDVLKGRVINFISAVLSEWNDANVKTLEQAREYTRKRQRASKVNKTVKPIRQEIEPSWATEPKKEYVEETKVELSPEIEERFRKYLERKEQSNAEKDDITE